MAQIEEIHLPPVKQKGNISLEEAITKRRSLRNFKKKDLGLAEISQLLWAAQGITAKKGGYELRSAPSAGALYPMEIYLVNKEGLFRYMPSSHSLEVLAQEDLRPALAAAALGQGSVVEAPLDIVICTVYQRVTVKYAERGIRYAHIEAGHVAENIHLQAVALGLGSVPIGAFDDEAVKRALSLPSEHEPLYIIPIGYAN